MNLLLVYIKMGLERAGSAETGSLPPILLRNIRKRSSSGTVYGSSIYGAVYGRVSDLAVPLEVLMSNMRLGFGLINFSMDPLSIFKGTDPYMDPYTDP